MLIQINGRFGMTYLNRLWEAQALNRIVNTVDYRNRKSDEFGKATQTNQRCKATRRVAG